MRQETDILFLEADAMDATKTKQKWDLSGMLTHVQYALWWWFVWWIRIDGGGL